MKRKFKFLYSILLVGLIGSASLAIQDPAPDPGNGSTWAGTNDPDPGDIPNIIVQNAASAPGNPNGTDYWFAASDSQSNPTYPSASTLGGCPVAGSICSSVNGHTQISAAPSTAPGNTYTETFNGLVDKVLAGDNYWVYAQACPSGVGANQSTCSNWVRLAPAGVQVETKPLPPTPFLPPVKADVTTNSITLHGDVTDPQDVQNWNMELDTVQSGVTAVLGPNAQRSYTGAQQITIGPSGGYNLTLLPNNRYKYLGQVEYFWSQFTPSPTPQAEPFTTTPVQPGPATVPNATITHCSAQIIVPNASGSTPNPTYTAYQVCLNNGAGCQTTGPSGIGGTPLPSDTTTFIFINLTDGQTYSGTSQALNEDRTTWSDGLPNTVPGFTTLNWGGTFTVGAVGNTDVFLNVSVSNPAGIQTWQIKSGATILASGSGDPTPGSPYHITTLTPNTQYTPTITLTENTGCTSGTLAFTPGTFTTTPFAPSSGNMTAPSATQITATWVDSLNPAGTEYQFKYCTDAGFTLNCITTSNIAAKTVTLAASPETQYFGEVLAENISRPTWPDSPYTNIGSTTTPNQPPSIVSGPTFTPWVSSGTLTVAATDNGGPGPLVFQWTVNPSGTGSPALTSAAGTTTISGSNATNVTQLTYTSPGTYTGTLTVTDDNGTGMSTTVPWSTNGVTQVPTQIAISPNAATVITANTQVFNAIVCDQFETIGNCNAGSQHIIAGQAVNWSVNGGGTPLTQNGTASYTFTATTPNSPNPPWTLTASLSGVSPANDGTAAITVLAAGPVVTSYGFVMNTNDKGGILSVTGHDNVVHSITSNFTSDPSVTFAPNSVTSADNVAGTTAVTFSKAGTFTLTDNLGSAISTSTVVTVPQVLTGITVSPNNITVQTLQTQQFSATCQDQFGNSMTPCNVTWTTSGGGSVSGAGAFSSSSLGQNIKVTATAGGKSGFAIVNVLSFDVSGAYAYPVPYKASFGTGVIHFTGLGSQASIRVYTASGHKVFDLLVNTTTYDWNVKNSSGENLASGVYFYVIQSPETKKNGKLIIIQ